MPVVPLATLATTSAAFARLTATATGEKVCTFILTANHEMNTTQFNAVSVVLVAGQYVMNADPSEVWFKSVAATGTVNCFYRN